MPRTLQMQLMFAVHALADNGPRHTVGVMNVYGGLAAGFAAYSLYQMRVEERAARKADERRRSSSVASSGSGGGGASAQDADAAARDPERDAAARGALW